jgi:hypothetical protein
MKVTTNFCDLCKNEVQQDKIHCIEMRWTNVSDSKFIDICSDCRNKIMDNYSYGDDRKFFIKFLNWLIGYDYL